LGRDFVATADFDADFILAFIAGGFFLVATAPPDFLLAMFILGMQKVC
jgi:hypothetical protein